MARWKAIGYAALAVGFGFNAFEQWNDGKASPMGGIGGRRRKRAFGYLSGEPLAKVSDVRTIEQRVDLIRKLLCKGGASAKLHEMASAIVSKKCRTAAGGVEWCVKEKDSEGEVLALFKAVRDPKSPVAVRYTSDMLYVDTFTGAERTLARKHSGDCFVKGTLVLKRGHDLVPVETLQPGDEIWGYDRWSRVQNTWDKPSLPTVLIRLNNGSSMRLTAEHKVWIGDEIKIPKHARGVVNSARIVNLRRVTVSELRPGDVVIQPDAIPFGSGSMDPDRAYVEGLYAADGFKSHPRDFAISGKDGCPKEAQKHEVEAICKRLGIPTTWHERYITVKDPEWAEIMAQMGAHAPEKRVRTLDLDAPAASELLRGVMADSGRNTTAGRTFTTTSRALYIQARVLLKMQGISCGARYIEDHGGLGTHPIYRLQTREPRKDGKPNKMLRVKEIIDDGCVLPCFDIETDDHFVWLPEADWTTSQCDDFVISLGSLLLAIGHPVKIRVIQTTGKSSWSHVYLLTPRNHLQPEGQWIPVDASVNKPLGWEAPGAAEVAATGKPAGMVIRVRDFDVACGSGK